MLKQTAQGLSGGKEGGKRKAPTEYLQKTLRSTLQSVDLWFMRLLSSTFPSHYWGCGNYPGAEQGGRNSARAARHQGLQASVIHLAELPSSVDIRLSDQ